MSSELRKKWWTAPVGHIVWFFITLICITLRKKIIIEDAEGKKFGSYQCIIALWHNRVFVPCYVYRYCIKGKKVPMSMLTSASKDGALLSTVAKNYGMRTVRGSSRRRGVAGFLDMVRELNAGCSMCITPDGPKGPIYKCHPGAVKLASVSGVPIVPARVSYSSCWRIRKAWDKFVIPKPFSRVIVKLGQPLYVPADLTAEQQAEYCEKLESLFAAGSPDFPPVTLEQK